MSNTSTPVPDGWDYHRGFLDDKQYLPPYIRGEDFPLFGTSRRPTCDDLCQLGLLPEARPLLPLEKQPHCVSLPGVHAIADDRKAQRYELYGPARLVLPEELLNRHWLWVGPPGVGKTTQGVQPQTARLLAEQTAEAMFSRDAASKLIDLKLASVRPGYSRLTMLVRPDMVNGHHICHGGYLFTLADSAFAYACNSYNRNTVASACHIDFLTPAREGELLEAECEERSLAGRTGVYDTTIRNARGKVVALFRGKSYRIAGEVIAGLEAEDSEPGASSSAARQGPDAVEGNPQ